MTFLGDVSKYIKPKISRSRRFHFVRRLDATTVQDGSTALASTSRKSRCEKRLTQHCGKGHAATSSSSKKGN